MALEAGMQPVPGCRITQLLGTGAFSEVWQAKRDDGQRMAFKFLDCRKLSPSMIAAEVKLLRSLTSLNHPNILPLFGVHSWGKYLVLMMELADGSLNDLHQTYLQTTGGNIPADHALDLLDQAAEALDFLATTRLANASGSRGLQHCDIKPRNLLLIGHQLKVADFGLAVGSGWHSHAGWRGTLPYAAPELHGGAAVPGTDQYALAVTFCELVMGERAFFKVENRETAPDSSPIDLTKLRDLEFPIISRALHAYPSSRWPSCKAFLQALRTVAKNSRKGPSTRIFPRGLLGSIRLALAAIL